MQGNCILQSLRSRYEDPFSKNIYGLPRTCGAGNP